MVTIIQTQWTKHDALGVEAVLRKVDDEPVAVAVHNRGIQYVYRVAVGSSMLLR